MLCFTNEARKSNIQRIEKLIDMLGHTTEETLSFVDYCALVDYLNIAKKAYQDELK